MSKHSEPAGCAEALRLSRRHMLAGATSLVLWAGMPRMASAAGARDPRLLTIILRGGLDGLALASPAADPDLERQRGQLAVRATGEGAGLPLDGFFVLNSAMPSLHALYAKGQAVIVHAVATPYRARSHFDGQDVLESGLAGVGRSETGWLNRALLKMPTAGQASAKGLASRKGLAVGAVVPLTMRGPAPVLSWIPKTSAMPLRHSTVERLRDLYAHTDPELARAFEEGLSIDKVAGADGMTEAEPAASMMGSKQSRTLPRGQLKQFVETAAAAARLMSAADGPRAGVLAYNGWDTHANAGAVKGQLANRLGGLDAAIQAYADGMGAAWKDTIVVIVTEFGRTARINGTNGTDHGTATAALVVGGAVKGGRVIADWPGLSDAALYQGRDLKPTLDLRRVLKGVLRDHLGVPTGVLAEAVFPASGGVKAMDGLVV